MSEAQIKRGDIFYIQKSASVCGSEQIAGRPGIIVSNDIGNSTSETVEVVYLTTRHKTTLPTHVPISSSARDSTALCEQITTVSIERIGDYCGRVTDEELRLIDEALMVSLNLAGKECRENEKNLRGGGTPERDKELAVALAERDVYKSLYEQLLARVMQGVSV